MPGIDALTHLVNLLLTGVKDTSNALGQDGPVAKLGAFGDLLPAAIAAFGSIKQLPSEIRDLDSDEAGQLISQAAEKIDLPNDKAEAIIRAGAQAANVILKTVTSQVREVGKVAKTHQDAVGPA